MFIHRAQREPRIENIIHDQYDFICEMRELFSEKADRPAGFNGITIMGNFDKFDFWLYTMVGKLSHKVSQKDKTSRQQSEQDGLSVWQIGSNQVGQFAKPRFNGLLINQYRMGEHEVLSINWSATIAIGIRKGINRLPFPGYS